MTVRLLDDDTLLLEETFEYPEPDIVLRAVSSYLALKYLSNAPENERSVVYFYADHNTSKHLLSYTGETRVSLQSRYSATHSKTDWLASIDSPLVGACESRTTSWSTDTRLAIEGAVAYKMRERGFEIINTENKTWATGGQARTGVNKALVERVAELIVRHQLAWLGLPLLAPKEQAEEQAEEEALAEVERKQPRPQETELWLHPAAGRKLFVKTGKREIRGEQTADGLVLLTSTSRIPASPRDYASSTIKAGHARLLKEGTREPDGTYSWQGRTEPAAPTVWLGAALGNGSGNVWQAS